MSPQVALLKTNATVHRPTQSAPYHAISVTNSETQCTIRIAATKSMPDPMFSRRRNANTYVEVSHGEMCACAAYARSTKGLFDAWLDLLMVLRVDASDQASYAFFPHFDHEAGEALAHASLIASLAVGKPVPACYEGWVGKYGAPALVGMLEEKRE